MGSKRNHLFLGIRSCMEIFKDIEGKQVLVKRDREGSGGCYPHCFEVFSGTTINPIQMKQNQGWKIKWLEEIISFRTKCFKYKGEIKTAEAYQALAPTLPGRLQVTVIPDLQGALFCQWWSCGWGLSKTPRSQRWWTMVPLVNSAPDLSPKDFQVLGTLIWQ